MSAIVAALIGAVGAVTAAAVGASVGVACSRRASKARDDAVVEIPYSPVWMTLFGLGVLVIYFATWALLNVACIVLGDLLGGVVLAGADGRERLINAVVAGLFMTIASSWVLVPFVALGYWLTPFAVGSGAPLGCRGAMRWLVLGPLSLAVLILVVPDAGWAFARRYSDAFVHAPDLVPITPLRVTHVFSAMPIVGAFYLYERLMSLRLDPITDPSTENISGASAPPSAD